MNLSNQIAKNYRDVYYGGNWTWVNLKDTLAGITWEQAVAKVYDFNTIAMLVYHMHYYVRVSAKVLEGGPLDGKDRDSFDVPIIGSQQEWEQLLQNMWKDVDLYAALIEQLPEQKLWETFVDEKYGNYYRNLHGIIEHVHYHLGQIVLIKKILLQSKV
ncbi:MAG: DinB family protein [Chitinophagales bacterium]|nr:DinB family protein [Chitinophagales bacterium]